MPLCGVTDPASSEGGRRRRGVAVHDEIPHHELRLEAFRKSGPGGPSVNTSDSAVRITHLPTGIVVEERDQGGQLRNRPAALARLRVLLKEQAE